MSNCRPNIPNFTDTECDFENGRVVALAFIHKDIHAAIYADPTNASLWVDGDYSADLHIFQEVRGAYDGGSPIDVPGVGNQDTRVINADRSLTVATFCISTSVFLAAGYLIRVILKILNLL